MSELAAVSDEAITAQNLGVGRRTSRYGRLANICFVLSGVMVMSLMIAAVPMGNSDMTIDQKSNILIGVAGLGIILVLLGLFFFGLTVGHTWVRSVLVAVSVGLITALVASPMIADPITSLIFGGLDHLAH